MGKVLEFRRSMLASEALKDGYVFKEKPAAKSSSCTLMPTACQLCGHKYDGAKNASRGADGKPCICGCHE